MPKAVFHATVPASTTRRQRADDHAEQFDSAEQQAEASHLGMWLFLGTELLFFGALFAAYTVYRFSYPRAFAAGSHELMIWAGAANTAILLLSSFAVAMAVHAAQTESRKLLTFLLLVGAALGGAFLVLHGCEYYRDYVEHHVPGKSFRFLGPAPDNKVQLFFLIYFLMTGLHGIHVFVGVALLTFMAVQAWRGKFSKTYCTPVEVSGLYWHFVDLIWVFLFPLFYLVEVHHP